MSYLFELKRAWLNLSRAQGFVLTVVITLGLTLGAVVCMFGLNWLLLVEPLPYPDQQKIVYIKGELYKDHKLVSEDSHAYPVLMALYRDRTETEFESIALLSYNDNIIKNVPNTPRVGFTYVSPEFFSILKIPMALGRPFSDAEGVDTQRPVAVISYSAWKRYFSGATDVIGKKIVTGNNTFEIVGVTAQNLAEPELLDNSWSTDVWLPWDFNERKLDGSAEGDWSNSFDHYKAIARLSAKNKTSQYLQSISEKLSNWLNSTRKNSVTDPALREYDIAIKIMPIDKKILGDNYLTSLLMLAATVALLCIAVTNVANLFYSRSASLRRTLAIQSAIGAKPIHIFKLLFSETLIICALAAVLAGIVSHLGTNILIDVASNNFPRIETLGFGIPELLFLILATLLLALIFAFLIQRTIDYRVLINSLQSSGKGSGLQISKKTHQRLIFSQVMVSGILIMATLVLSFESLKKLTAEKPVATEGRYLVRINFMRNEGDTTSPMDALRDFVNRFPQSPMIEKVSYSSVWPYWGYNTVISQSEGSLKTISVAASEIDENWLDLFDVSILQGRNFTQAEVKDKNDVVMINQAAAKLISAAHGDIIGSRIFWPSQEKSYEIVGVVKNTDLPGSSTQPRIFSMAAINGDVIFKTKDGQVMSRERLSEILKGINSRLYVSLLRDWDQFYDDQMARDRLTLYVSFAVSTLTLFLVGVGLYGVLSYQVRLRRYELGVRMALGAKPKTIIELLIRDTSRHAGIGLLGSFIIGGILYIFPGSKLDLFSAITIGSLLLPLLVTLTFIVLVVLFTCYFPVRSVVNEQPIFSLRANTN